MNDIQKNYLIGLLLKQINSFDIETLNDANIDNDNYLKNIRDFIEQFSDNSKLMNELYIFMKSEDTEFISDPVEAENVGLFTNVKFNDQTFTITNGDFTELIINACCYMVDYLPLGSIVRVDGSLEMVEQRMVRPKGKDYYIDYRTIPYPTGVFNEQMYHYINDSDIEEVVFTGYTDEENEGFELALKESLIGTNVFSIKYQDEV